MQAVLRFGALAVGMVCVAVIAPPVAAQDAAATPALSATSAAKELRRAHDLSKTAKSAEDFAKLIAICDAALAETTDPTLTDYGRRLLSWSLNRHGEELIESQKDDEAMQDFSRAIELDGTRWQAIHNRAVGYARVGNGQQARADFDRTLELNPRYANAWYNRGELRYGEADYEGAIADYDQAIDLAPDDAEAFNSRGHAYYRMGNYRQAISDFEQALTLNPQLADAYVNRGDAWADLGTFEQAARDYRAAIRIDPNLARAYRSAAWLMATCPTEDYRNSELAVQAALKAIELLGRDDPRYLDAAAAAYANAGDFDKATDFAQRALTGAPDELAAQIRARAERYGQKQPYRDVPEQAQAPSAPASEPAAQSTAPTEPAAARSSSRRNAR